MVTVRTVAELRAALAPHRRAGRSIGLVPTMGAFHAGHLELMRAARAATGVVVVSLFVNPTQFGETSDLEQYPRDEAADVAQAEAEGVDVLFAPEVEEVYPAGFATAVRVSGVTEPLEGVARGPEHFEGVATIVLKLLNMSRPDVAFFGQKDAQQAVVIRRLVADLDVPVRIETVPTVREPDGLAMSSRNGRLAGADRERARALSAALEATSRAIEAGERDAAALAAHGREAMQPFDVEPEYLALVDPETLTPLDELNGRGALVAVAARVGAVRLIDNTLIRTNREA
jgi:pantoate--beta-alanine ligase